MATFLVWVITALTVAGALFALIVVVDGRADLMADMPPDSAPATLPHDRPVSADNVTELYFDRAFRGYRMDQVDAVLDRLVAELAARDSDRAKRLERPARLERPVPPERPHNV